MDGASLQSSYPSSTAASQSDDGAVSSLTRSSAVHTAASLCGRCARQPAIDRSRYAAVRSVCIACACVVCLVCGWRPFLMNCSALAGLFDSLTLRDEVDVEATRVAITATDRGSAHSTRDREAPTASATTEGEPTSQQHQARQLVSGVQSALFPHQVAGLRWMERREAGQSADGTSPMGGIVADAAGLGKTLMMLALVAQQKKRHESQLRQQPQQPPTATLHGGQPAASAPVDACALPNRCTLVVCPRALLRQWQRECTAHLEVGLLSVDCVAGGSSRKALSAADIARCDVVVTSYETIRTQHQKLLTQRRQAIAQARVHQPPSASAPSAASTAAASDVSFEAPLFAVTYLRLIADEAHRLRNRKAQLTAAVCALSAVHRWYVTATPLQNSIDDLYPAFLFLRYAPYSDYSVWRQYMHSKDGKGLERCRTLLRAVAIRRRKAESQQQLLPADDSREEGSSVQSGVQMTAKHVQLVELTLNKQSTTRARTALARTAVVVGDSRAGSNLIRARPLFTGVCVV